MAPTRPTSFRSLISRQSYEDDLTGVGGEFPIQQAGRTATPLAAHLLASEQSLRHAPKPKHHRQCSKSSSSPDLRPSRAPAIDIIAGNVAQARRAASHLPLVPSPLNPASVKTTECEEEECRSSSLTGLTERFNDRPSEKATELTDNKSLRTPLSPARRSSARLSKLSRPRSLRDLGSDYTRYFNPFATPTSSQQNLRSQSSCPHLMSGTNDVASGRTLSKRPSNPFEDSKRLSYQSLHASSAGAGAQEMHQAPGSSGYHHGKITGHAGLTLLAIPPRADTPYFIQDADPEKAAFFQYIDDRLGAPQTSFPYMSDPREDDDDLHQPEWDDDIRLALKFREHFTKDNIISTVGLFLMLLGLMTVFIALPIISYTGWSIIDYMYETPFDEIWRPWLEHDWYWVDNRSHPLMRNMRRGLIDPDTPKSAMTRKSATGELLRLVFSDEFNAQNRTFYSGDDPYWYGFDGWYGATNDIEWYDPDALNTGNGTLNIQLDAFTNHNLPYRSGMLNSWNQLCFKGGVFEVSMSLPGPAGVRGLWPGAWTMGNLGRPGYLATTDGMWPYTYSECDAGITPNQSMTDGTSYLPGQRLSSCTCVGEDHPTPDTGRGAPEIDIAEVSADWGGLAVGVATQSYQVAPFDIWYYPNYDYMETPNSNVSSVNTYTGGPFQQAVSTTTMLNNSWYDDVAYQKFAFEYVPGTDEDAFIAWTIGDEEMMRFDARAVGPNGNVGQRIISEEPMSMILNLGLSHNWVDIDFAALRFPTVLRLDYVRWYQRKGYEMVTCDPPGYETTEYIRRHPEAYQNPNVTLWEHAGYSWPRNTLMHKC